MAPNSNTSQMEHSIICNKHIEIIIWKGSYLCEVGDAKGDLGADCNSEVTLCGDKLAFDFGVFDTVFDTDFGSLRSVFFWLWNVLLLGFDFCSEAFSVVGPWARFSCKSGSAIGSEALSAFLIAFASLSAFVDLMPSLSIGSNWPWLDSLRSCWGLDFLINFLLVFFAGTLSLFGLLSSLFGPVVFLVTTFSVRLTSSAFCFGCRFAFLTASSFWASRLWVTAVKFCSLGKTFLRSKSSWAMILVSVALGKISAPGTVEKIGRGFVDLASGCSSFVAKTLSVGFVACVAIGRSMLSSPNLSSSLPPGKRTIDYHTQKIKAKEYDSETSMRPPRSYCSLQFTTVDHCSHF